jgi:membrane protein
MRTIVLVFKEAVKGFIADRAITMGAAMAYYTLFSLAPMLVIVIAVAGLVFGREAAQGAIVNELSGFLGRDGGEALQGLIGSAGRMHSGIFATVLSALTLLLGATTALVEMQDSLDVIWRAPPAKGSTLVLMLRSRLVTIIFILALGFLLLVSLVVSAGVTAFSVIIDRWMPGLSFVIGAINFAVSFLVTTLLFALIYKVLPRVDIAWRDVFTGAALAAALFTLGRWAIAFYIGQTELASSYGAAGTFILVMVWVYYSTQILFFGAEFARAWSAHRTGAGLQPSPRDGRGDANSTMRSRERGG